MIWLIVGGKVRIAVILSLKGAGGLMPVEFWDAPIDYSPVSAHRRIG